MPLQQSNLVEKRVDLPTSKDVPDEQKEYAVIEVGELTGGDMIYIEDFETKSPLSILTQVLPHRIKEWNVKDTDGSVAEINFNTVRRLPTEDLVFLIAAIVPNDDNGVQINVQQLDSEQKKSSSDSSTPPLTA